MAESLSFQEIRQKVESLERELSFFGALLHLIRDPVFILDGQKAFIRVNPPAEEMLGYSEKELREMAFLHVVNLEDLSRVRNGIDSMRDDPQVRFEAQVINRRGERVPTEVSGCRREYGYLLLLKDLRAQIDREGSWEKKERELKDRIRERDQYARELQAMKDLYKERVKEIETMREEALVLSHTDDLTGLYNHRFFIQQLSRELERLKRYPSALSLLMIDIDFFKQYNDTNGHLAGDQALKATGLLIQRGVRQTDIVARYGGEEFVAILVNAGKEVAGEIGERVRRNVAGTHFPNGHLQPNGNFTVSIGLATHSPGLTLTDLLRQADDSVYRAKKRGRNRVEA